MGRNVEGKSMGRRKENSGPNMTQETTDPIYVTGIEPTPDTPQGYEILVPFTSSFLLMKLKLGTKISFMKKKTLLPYICIVAARPLLLGVLRVC